MSHYNSSMENQKNKDMHLLSYNASSSQLPSPWPTTSSNSLIRRSTINHLEGTTPPSLDLQLSISVTTPLNKPPLNSSNNTSTVLLRRKVKKDEYKYSNININKGVETLKWQAAEHIRLAAMEKAYAERVRELSRREMELAQSEFARARHMWDKAREEVERAERMKERATRKVDDNNNNSSCMEITCQSCNQKFTT